MTESFGTPLRAERAQKGSHLVVGLSPRRARVRPRRVLRCLAALRHGTARDSPHARPAHLRAGCAPPAAPVPLARRVQARRGHGQRLQLHGLQHRTPGALPGQLACRTAARPCATPHPDSRPPQLGELNVLEEEEIDALLAGAHAALWTAAAPRPWPSLGPPALRRPATAVPSSGRPASSSLGQSTGTCWLARVSLSLMGPESRR